MKKYEEKHYSYENIKDHIYPWIKNEMADSHALNGKHLSEDVTALEFLGDMKIVFAIRRGKDSYEIMTDNMISPDTDIMQMYHTACENLVRDVEFVVGNTWYGAYVIVADGIHEASSVCFKHIWQVCADKLKDDLIIMAPNKETVLFAPLSQQKVVSEMLEQGKQLYDTSTDSITDGVFIFTREGKELSVYGS